MDLLPLQFLHNHQTLSTHKTQSSNQRLYEGSSVFCLTGLSYNPVTNATQSYAKSINITLYKLSVNAFPSVPFYFNCQLTNKPNLLFSHKITIRVLIVICD